MSNGWGRRIGLWAEVNYRKKSIVSAKNILYQSASPLEGDQFTEACLSSVVDIFKQLRDLSVEISNTKLETFYSRLHYLIL